MRVAVDAMGGDYGPKVIVEGAIQASQDYQVDILLVGVEDVIKREFGKTASSPSRVTIVNAAESIGMGEGVFAARRKRMSSIRVGTQLVKDGEAEAFVSTGNTAAIVYVSRKILGVLKGVDRPALALLVPTMEGMTLLIDVGANVDCRAHHLEQFAIMGQIFMENILGLSNPRIGLMSIGEERIKGNDLTKEAFERLRRTPLNFIGNVEGKDIYSGRADVIVCDGFTGNVALKVSEGVIETFFNMVRTEVMKNIFSKIGFFLMKRNVKRLYKKVDYSEYGGAHLLGLRGACVIGHGRSNANAVKNAIGRAKEFVANRVQEKIQNEIVRFTHNFEQA